jgi:hypothetical protein
MRKLLLAWTLMAMPLPAWAWGADGHRYIGELAVRHLPEEMPAFLRTPLAASQIGMLAQEPDISRGAGQPHDADRDPGHFVDVSDDGSVLGGPKLTALPANRRDYDTALRAVGAEQYKAGFLPYQIMGGWQQLVKDFALWRRDVAAQKYARKFAMTGAQKRGYAQAQALRQMLTLRDLGVWAHYVGDGSQPMHVSVHYNGWGEGPNPGGYVTTPGLHAKFESEFVHAHVREADVEARFAGPYAAPSHDLQTRVHDYLSGSIPSLTRVYDLEKQGAFDQATPAAKDLAVGRLAAGALALRNFVVDAWRASGEAMLGYKAKASVSDLEAGKVDPRTLD